LEYVLVYKYLIDADYILIEIEFVKFIDILILYYAKLWTWVSFPNFIDILILYYAEFWLEYVLVYKYLIDADYILIEIKFVKFIDILILYYAKLW